jgi:phosphatidylglycerophosphate synthase
MPSGWLNIPNTLSLIRIGAIPALLFLASAGYSSWLVGLMIAVGLSDAFDGTLARYLNQESDLGVKLDSWGDFAVFVSSPLIIWLYDADMFFRELGWIIAAFLAFLIPIVLGFIKFGKLTSYHTWLAKGMAWLVGIGIILLLLGETALLFRAGVVVLVVSAVEEIAITWRLDSWTSNVPSIFYLRREHSSTSSERLRK